MGVVMAGRRRLVQDTMNMLCSVFLSLLVGSLGCVLVISFSQGLVLCRNAVP